jgi:hypothetical protein
MIQFFLWNLEVVARSGQVVVRIVCHHVLLVTVWLLTVLSTHSLLTYSVCVQRVPWMTKPSLPSPDKDMLSVASSALCATQISTEIVFCLLHNYMVFLFIFYTCHYTFAWHTKLSSILCFCLCEMIKNSGGMHTWAVDHSLKNPGSRRDSKWPRGYTPCWQVYTNKTRVMPFIPTKSVACMSTS